MTARQPRPTKGLGADKLKRRMDYESPQTSRANVGSTADRVLYHPLRRFAGCLYLFCRGKVFANAQTGNIVLFSAYLFDGEWDHCARYLIPVLSFLLGIFAVECIHRHFKYMEKVHWRQLIILAEIVLLFVVGFLPQRVNTLANVLVSFVCAMQVQTFRKVRGHAYASTMCIGNMRSGTEALCVYFHTRDREVLHKALTYFGVIGLFAVGAGLGALLTAWLAERGIWVSCALLAVSFLIMFIREEEEKK